MKDIKFNDLEVGEYFLYKNEVYVKINFIFTKLSVYNSFCLNTSSLDCVDDFEIVKKIEVEIILKLL